MCADATSSRRDSDSGASSAKKSASKGADSQPSDDGLSSLPFRTLGSYDWPKLPAQRRLQWLWRRLKREFGNEEASPLVTNDEMHRLTEAQMDERVPWPPNAALLDALDQSVADTVRGLEGAPRCRVIVLPPGDGADGEPSLMQGWARRHGHVLLEPPERRSLLHSAEVEVPSLAGEGVLVIPELAAWFLRHTHGLTLLRRLIDALNTLERPMIVGCNSWAWAFLNKAMNLGLRLPDPLVPQAYDAERLLQWLGHSHHDHAGGQTSGQTGVQSGTQADDHAGEQYVFRRSDTGAAVLATEDDGSCSDTYLQSLAAHSMGIPWVAWHVFRRVQRRLPEGKSVDEARSVDEAKTMDVDEDENTAWLSSFPTFTLPPDHEPAARLVLHAVLLHGSLSEDALLATLPVAGCRDLLAALLHSGHLIESAAGFECAPVAYPDIRQTLSEAGFPLDKL